MEAFQRRVSEALAQSGGTGPDLAAQARRAISEIEQTMETGESLRHLVETLGPHLKTVAERAVGRAVESLLIAPVPPYLEPLLPVFLAAFPKVVLADNFRAGQTIGGQFCAPLSQALEMEHDAYFLGTITSRYAKFFRDQFPPDRTLGVWEMRCHGADFLPQDDGRRLEALLAAIGAAARPLVFLTAYPDATMVATLRALQDQGHDVFVVSRRPISEAAPANTASLASLGGVHACRLDFGEMLALLRRNRRAPVILNYQRFFASNLDMRNTLFLMAYSLAVLQTARAQRVLHLYDVYNVCTDGFADEAAVVGLYRAMIETADGVLVNSDPFDALDVFEKAGKPVLGFLRYAPRSELLPRTDQTGLHIAMITGFLGEHGDPTRRTQKAVLSLLKQGAHIHYYSDDPVAKAFHADLDADLRPRFQLHTPISDQAKLVREISQFDLGWFVVDMAPFSNLEGHFSSDFGRRLAEIFPKSSFGTAALYYGAAGLPTVMAQGCYALRLFADGAAIAVTLTEDGDLAGSNPLLAQVDLVAARAALAPDQFVVDAHIARLCGWLDQFYQDQPVRALV